KPDPNRVKITVGGNLIEYPHEVTTQTADLVTTKILWNSVVSYPNTKYVYADVKSFYLNTPIEHFEYMQIPNKLIQTFIDKYNLQRKTIDGFVYMKIRKGIYGLPQAGILVKQLLKKILVEYGYYEVPHTSHLWKHQL
ncbi:hypothetical protein ACHAXS_006719, partial [Conticribra weissflogii]